MATFCISPAYDTNNIDGIHQGEVDDDIEAKGESIDAEALLLGLAQDGTGAKTSSERLMANLKDATKGVVGEKTLKGYDS